ncbi:AEC family transporter [Suttonella sp. R2A3]|uniref:AEC family transporter n=1 Tax=Suttonella sp. R2A3 TaxID=2908648 RepID=UPI001F21CB16|nr:AEC family transporter [Suttonella sp. R2A3]UJF24350.1 AEC family transporter [Suttonella sp. R2A3]
MATGLEAFWLALGVSANILTPILGLIAFGWWLKRRGELEHNLVMGLNQLVYRYALPGLLFFSITGSEVSIASQWRVIASGYLGVLGLYFLASWWAKGRYASAADRGVFVQGVFRGNLAIIGLALCGAVYGDYGQTVGAIAAGSIALLLNILAVFTLTQVDGQKLHWTVWLARILRNPLVIAILAAAVVKMFSIPIPEMVQRFGDYAIRVTLPLALLCIGATFNPRGVLGADRMAYSASAGRMFLSPLLFVVLGALFGLRGQDLGILFILGAAPAATAGYVMAKAMGGNDVAAANIIAITTAGSLVLMAPVIALFQVLGWI